MGDGAARHRSALRGTEPCRVITLCNKRRKFQRKQVFFQIKTPKNREIR